MHRAKRDDDHRDEDQRLSARHAPSGIGPKTHRILDAIDVTTSSACAIER